jgi:hypothetical protein
MYVYIYIRERERKRDDAELSTTLLGDLEQIPKIFPVSQKSAWWLPSIFQISIGVPQTTELVFLA